MVKDGTWEYAQQAVLGSMLIDARCVPLVMAQTSEDDFTVSYQTIFKAIKKLFQSGDTIDPVTVLDVVGSQYRDMILTLMEITPTCANCERYAAICRDQSRIHRIWALSLQIVDTDDMTDIQHLLEESNAIMADKPQTDIVTMKDALASFMERHSARKADYLRWPIPGLNAHLFSEPGDFIVIGGKPSTGKTAWALQCARYWSKRKKVGIFSLETTTEKLFDRKMCGVMDLDMSDLKRNDLTHADWDRICGKTDDVLDMNLELIRASDYTVPMIRAKTMMRGYEIIIVDYLQLVEAKGENRATIVANISIQLHRLAQSLRVTVVALSQVTTENGSGNTPGLDSLRESRQIGQDADVVMMFSLGEDSKQTGQRNLHILKNKEGTLGKLTLYFDGSRQVFSKEKIPERPPKTEKQYRAEPVAGQMVMLEPNTPVPF